MGYFSSLAAQYAPYDHDHSDTPPEMQLLWRLEELEDRYQKLTNRKTGRRDEGEFFSEDQLRYVLPNHFFSAANVRRAIDLAILDLKECYGIFVAEAPEKDEPVTDEITGMQISFPDILSACSQRSSPCAA